MTVTSSELRHVRLHRRPFGYRRRDVDSALESAAKAVEGLWQERSDLVERVHDTEQELRRYRDIEEMLRKTLITAERSADVMRADARRDAERILREAEQRSREIVGEARHERERVLQEVRRLEQHATDTRARLQGLLSAAERLLEEDDRERLDGEAGRLLGPARVAS